MRMSLEASSSRSASPSASLSSVGLSRASRSHRRGSRLDYFYSMLSSTVLKAQDAVTGLVPSSPSSSHAWVRDNLYCILSVWSLSMAYRKAADLDEDRAKSHELEQATVKCMRGLLTSLLQQRAKLESLKRSCSPSHSLHAKFCCKTGLAVVGDTEWGHLQMDAVALYLLTLAQMTASGLQIIFTLDEVAFVQNLVFFVESAYCTPDFGIWERGDKTNTGIVELNASSIGMAKAALEAVNELDLFGARGGPASVIHVMADETQKCQAVLKSMLPRESLSKETDASLLTIVGYPAFAVESDVLIEQTCDVVLTKLSGRYGCRRFLRDGYKTPREDSSRLHYEPWELRLFENIECQWPMFFCYLLINASFSGDNELADKYADAIENLMVDGGDGDLRHLPQLYSVSAERVTAEEVCPGSQEREPAGRVPFLWAQSLYVIGKLLQEGLVAPGEIDPINRRLSSLKKPDVVVQIVVLAKDEEIRGLLASHGIDVPTLQSVAPIEVLPARMLSHLYTFLGRNAKLGLTGRSSKDVGILTTSKLYKIQNRIFAFTPQRFDVSRNYMDVDTALMMTTLEYGLNYLSTCWSTHGRPLMTLIVGSNMLDNGGIHPAMMATLKKVKNGYIDGARVVVGDYNQFLSTSCITNLSFLGAVEEGQPDRLLPLVERFLSDQMGKPVTSVYTLLGQKMSQTHSGSYKRRASMRGSIKRTRSLKHSDSQKQATLSPHHLVRQESVNEEDCLLHAQREEEYRQRVVTESQYAENSVDELVQMLASAGSLDEQGDILHYLVNKFGLDHRISVAQTGETIEVSDLLKTLYEAACAKKNWGIVRHAAGYLGKKVEDLSKSVTDLLVRQKQVKLHFLNGASYVSILLWHKIMKLPKLWIQLTKVTVGMPPDREITLSGGKLTSSELRQIIHSAYGGDDCMAMLSQELLVYLGMFIQTEQHLFHGMLRMRIGLIIQVMASELARSLKLGDDEDGVEELINLSPFEMRSLLHHIMSGREFGVHAAKSGYSIVCDNSTVSKKKHKETRNKWKKYIQKVRRSSRDSIQPGFQLEPPKEDSEGDEVDRQGSWMRRRRLDGALNRVPKGFYERIWMVLERCHALAMQGKLLEFGLTQEMTSGEMKFALRVEGALNTIPDPEFRQLMVEALMVLSLIAEHKVVHHFGSIVHVENIVRRANELFLQDHFRSQGDATLCCATNVEGIVSDGADCSLKCGGTAGICRHFYDSAPIGMCGTMSYMVRASCLVLDAVPKEGEIDCQVS